MSHLWFPSTNSVLEHIVASHAPINGRAVNGAIESREALIVCKPEQEMRSNEWADKKKKINEREREREK